MKKMTFLACAAMLTSAVVLTGCKGEGQNEPQQNVPTVATDITISLPGQLGNGPLRMPGATVQRGGFTQFNGIKNITLVPFAKSAVITKDFARLGDNIELGTLGTTTKTDATELGRTKVFEAQNVPTGTSSFLFYGESAATGTEFQIGYLGASVVSNTPDGFTFSLKQIHANASDITGNAAYTGLLAYLNSVANATDGATPTPKAWKDYTAEDNEGYYELFKIYSSVTVLSSFGIRRMMTDLYKNLKLNGTNDVLATNIKAAIANATYASVNAETGEVTLVEGLQNFPGSLNLPDGAVAVVYDATPTVKAFGGNAARAYGSLAPAQLDRYVYAPSLWYYSNTRIKTSVNSEKEHYVDGASWASILAQYPNDNSSVNSKTRSVALKDTIQYAVGRLDVMVKVKEATALEDNDSIKENNKVAIPDGGFPVSAVIVGGQKNVGFDFTPATYKGSATVAYTIYDKIMDPATISAVSSGYSSANSTLVLETAASEDEYICVEFTNNSAKDFYGVDGIVPIGGKFYLVGKLTASAATQTGNQVFKQDYTTTARLSIKDLKTAYSTIPDLRAPQLEIGFMVDLTWKAGHTYDIDFE